MARDLSACAVARGIHGSYEPSSLLHARTLCSDAARMLTLSSRERQQTGRIQAAGGCMRFACLITAALVTVSTTNGAGVIQARQAPAAAPAAQAKPNPDAEPDPMLLWPDGAPGALGNEPADRPTLTLFRARQPSGAAIIVAPGGGYSALASNHEGPAGRQPAQCRRHHDVRPQVPPRPQVPSPDRARRRAARHPAGSRPRQGVRGRARQDRHHGLLRGRASRVDCRHALRRRKARGARCHRSRQQPAGLSHPRLSRRLVRSRDLAQGVGTQSPRRQPRSEARWKTCRTTCG